LFVVNKIFFVKGWKQQRRTSMYGVGLSWGQKEFSIVKLLYFG